MRAKGGENRESTGLRRNMANVVGEIGGRWPKRLLTQCEGPVDLQARLFVPSGRGKELGKTYRSTD